MSHQRKKSLMTFLKVAENAAGSVMVDDPNPETHYDLLTYRIAQRCIERMPPRDFEEVCREVVEADRRLRAAKKKIFAKKRRGSKKVVGKKKFKRKTKRRTR